MEEEKREHDLKMKKMEAEMEQVFEMKVKEKKQKLKDSELELTRRHEDRKKVCFTKFNYRKFICDLYRKLYSFLSLIETCLKIFNFFSPDGLRKVFIIIILYPILLNKFKMRQFQKFMIQTNEVIFNQIYVFILET